MSALTVVNKAFSAVFIVEALLKIFGLGPRRYIMNRWNQVDFLIVLMSLPELFLDVGIAGPMFRLFRVGRLFRLVQRAKGLRTLFNTLIVSLPAIFNVGSLLFLLMFVYAVLGMSLFGDLASNGAPFALTSFRTFGSSLLTLFRVFTGDGWGRVLRMLSGCTQ